jgi:hypothetical protein
MSGPAMEDDYSRVMPPKASDEALYEQHLNWLWGAVHELPAGVLWGANAAAPGQCTEMLVGLQEFADVCARLGLEGHAEFIEGCRWHFDHYPHYLERRRHFRDYATYVRDRGGSLTVPQPPKARF